MTTITSEHDGIRIHRFSGGEFEAAPRSSYGVWHQQDGNCCLKCPIAGPIEVPTGMLALHDGALGAAGQVAEGAEAFEIELSRDLLDDVARVEYGVNAPLRLEGGARLIDDPVLAQMTISLLRISDGIVPSPAAEATGEGSDEGVGVERVVSVPASPRGSGGKDPLAGRRARVSLGTLAWAIAAHLLGHHMLQRRDTTYHARIGKVFAYIEDNLSGPVRLESMARHTGLSVFHFSRVFSRQTGRTPQQYVRQRRVRRARRMLLNTQLSLAEIAYACGFSHQSHFTTVFREQTGRTPGQFRGEATANGTALELSDTQSDTSDSGRTTGADRPSA